MNLNLVEQIDRQSDVITETQSRVTLSQQAGRPYSQPKYPRPKVIGITGYDYFWQGDRLVEEVPLYADGTPVYDAAIQWLYKGDELEPFARYEKGQLHYVVCDQIGTPRELFDERSNLKYQRRVTFGDALGSMPTKPPMMKSPRIAISVF